MIYLKKLRKNNAVVKLTEGALLIALSLSFQACSKPKATVKRPDAPNNSSAATAPNTLPSDLPSDTQAGGGNDSNRPKQGFGIAAGSQVFKGAGMTVFATVGSPITSPITSDPEPDKTKRKLKVVNSIHGKLYTNGRSDN